MDLVARRFDGMFAFQFDGTKFESLYCGRLKLLQNGIFETGLPWLPRLRSFLLLAFSATLPVHVGHVSVFTC